MNERAHEAIFFQLNLQSMCCMVLLTGCARTHTPLTHTHTPQSHMQRKHAVQKHTQTDRTHTHMCICPHGLMHMCACLCACRTLSGSLSMLDPPPSSCRAAHASSQSRASLSSLPAALQVCAAARSWLVAAEQACLRACMHGPCAFSTSCLQPACLAHANSPHLSVGPRGVRVCAPSTKSLRTHPSTIQSTHTPTPHPLHACLPFCLIAARTGRGGPSTCAPCLRALHSSSCWRRLGILPTPSRPCCSPPCQKQVIQPVGVAQECVLPVRAEGWRCVHALTFLEGRRQTVDGGIAQRTKGALQSCCSNGAEEEEG